MLHKELLLLSGNKDLGPVKYVSYIIHIMATKKDLLVMERLMTII